MSHFTLHLDAGVTLPGEGALQMGADIWLPEEGEPAAALVCLPGGNMNRRYFDLRPPAGAGGGDPQAADGDSSFSFAHAMCERGFAVVTIDYLGLGGSSRPADGYTLTPELLTRANANAVGEVLRRLREGHLSPRVPALPGLRSIGVGHSMGAMMTILVQATTQPHAAVALLGFSTRGLAEYMPQQVRELASDPTAVRERLAEFAKAMFVVPYPVIRSSPESAGIYAGASAEPRGVAALKSATEHLLPVPAFLSMIPGNVAPEAATIDVPVFLGLGERDMAGPPHQIPAAFPKSPDVTLYLQPGAGHSHFLFASRAELFERMARWARAVV